MKWIKEREPWRAELIHDCDLESDGKLLISASKELRFRERQHIMGIKRLGGIMFVCAAFLLILRLISAGRLVGNG